MTIEGRADATLSAVVRALGSVLLGFGLLSIAHGALFALIGVRLAAAGISSTVIGLVMSAYFVGLLGGSLSCDRVIARVGHIRAFAVFAATAAITVLLLALSDLLVLWVAAAGGSGLLHGRPLHDHGELAESPRHQRDPRPHLRRLRGHQRRRRRDGTAAAEPGRSQRLRAVLAGGDPVRRGPAARGADAHRKSGDRTALAAQPAAALRHLASWRRRLPDGRAW